MLADVELVLLLTHPETAKLKASRGVTSLAAEGSFETADAGTANKTEDK